LGCTFARAPRPAIWESLPPQRTGRKTGLMAENNVPRVVVITGGTAGVGRATARAFARRGASVALLARGRDRLDDACAEVKRLGARALGIPTDVASAAQVDLAAERVEREIGPIDVWVNNAMATVFSKTDEVTPEEFERSVKVTFFGTVHGTQAAL